jgi:Transglycosylase SLT domain/Putative peptidoglycan binding domain
MRPRILAAAASLAVAVASPADARINPQNAGLQIALRAWGYYEGPIDAIAGPMTARAVRRFQRAKGLPVDGIPRPTTRRALGRLGRPLYGTRVIRRGMVGWDVSVLQYLLSRRGSPTGIIDGYFGDETTRALRRFQRRSGLVADSVAGPATRGALERGRRPPRRPTRAAIVSTIDYWAGRNGVSAALMRALAWVESGFQARIVSPAGARGIMQVRPKTWEFTEEVLIGHEVPKTWTGNIRIGVRYFRHLLDQFRGDRWRALAAYNQGAASLRLNGMFRETRRFVLNVLAAVGRV